MTSLAVVLLLLLQVPKAGEMMGKERTNGRVEHGIHSPYLRPLPLFQTAKKRIHLQPVNQPLEASRSNIALALAASPAQPFGRYLGCLHIPGLDMERDSSCGRPPASHSNADSIYGSKLHAVVSPHTVRSQ